jgi:hypothetical protein
MTIWVLVAVLVAILLAVVLVTILLAVRSTKRRNPHIYQDEDG